MAKKVRPRKARPTDKAQSIEKVPELALQDVARYQEQLFRLLLHHDDRALRTLSLYLTVIGALATVSLALNQGKLFGPYVAIFLAAAALSLLVGCGCAYTAVRPAQIYLAGRKPDFWQWAVDNEQTQRETASAYLNQAAATIVFNEKISGEAAYWLGRSHLCGIAAPFIGVACALFAYVSRNYIT